MKRDNELLEQLVDRIYSGEEILCSNPDCNNNITPRDINSLGGVYCHKCGTVVWP